MLLLGPTLASLLLTASLAAAQSQSSAEAQPQSSTPTVAPTAAPTYPTGGVITTSVGAFTRDNGTSSDYETRILDTATIKYILANVTVTFPTSSDWWAADARNAWPNIALLGGPLNNVSLPSLPNQYSRYWYTIGWNVTLHNEDTSLLKAPTFLARGGLSQEPFEANLTRRNGNEIGKKQLVDAKPGQGYYLVYELQTGTPLTNFMNVTSDKFEIRAGINVTYPPGYYLPADPSHNYSEDSAGVALVFSGTLMVLGWLTAVASTLA